ncbi:MAG: hypothetical protein NZ473_01710 [Candidatus Kapabacteria bacterium]|nr:hypothetical protein [Candidatus Kapabacteria bacterium]MCS7169905.1 hypothetical protein [Candidatus Kapabacteria bacterium]MDW7996079.1 hypothetical protein [Bacteroidota bacterium]MDW8225297.1 hypothetical protein [Bacteroidota bacterium]
MRRQTALLFLLVLVGCQPDWGPEEERFVQAYAEILVARELYPDTTQGNARVRAILRHYGYTDEEEFRRQFLHRAREPAHLRRLFDSAAARAQHMLMDSLRSRPR